MKRTILDKNFKNYKQLNSDELLSLTNGVYFFDTENAPIFPSEIVDKYNLQEVEYDTLKEFQISKNVVNPFLNTLIKAKKITTKIYIWMFGSAASDTVVWGNSIDDFIEFIFMLSEIQLTNDIKSDFEIYVHNLAWDIEFFKYYFKEKGYKQILHSDDKEVNKLNKNIEYGFDITETDGTVHNSRVQLEKIKKEKVITRGKNTGKVKTTTLLPVLNFKDSAKITPMSLKKISEKMISVDDIYIKNSDDYKYNLVRDPDNYIPNEIEAWYQYCDIYLLKEWYIQFAKPLYLDNDVKMFSISQIAFDSILKYSYADNILREKYKTDSDKKELTDREIYERHFDLRFIESNILYKEYFNLSYKGGHTTGSIKHKELGKEDDKVCDNKRLSNIELNEIRKNFIIKGVSMDITSSYPSQMCNKKLPFGRPIYNKGKYKDFYIDDDNNKLKYDFHFITVAFDGFKSKQKNNNFGLNLKLRGLTPSQREHLKVPANESAIHNIIDGNFVGSNKIEVNAHKRKNLIKKYDKHNFIVTLTSFEWDEWNKNFDFFITDKKVIKKDVKYIDYVSLQSEIGHFKKGLDVFFKIKEDNDGEDGNEALKENAKLIINSFYGKHCSNREREQKIYNMNKDIICFETVNEENEIKWEDKKLFAKHYGSAVTSYGRVQLRETCRLIGNEYFIYADTDSLKFEISKDELIKRCKENNVPISFKKQDKRLGYWDFEFQFEDFKCVGQKKYMYKKKGTVKKNINNITLDTGKPYEYSVKCAGLPKDVREMIKNKEDFAIGKEFIKKGKRKVIGGNLLLDIKYSLNDLIR